MARRVSSSRFVGRDEELAALTDALRRAQDGDGAAVLIAGEAGIGKSRLVAELEARAVDAGARVLVGECVDLPDAELPFAPVIAALRPLVRGRTEPELDALLGPARTELARLLPEVGPAPAGDETPSQGRLFEVLHGVLGREGAAQPVVLVLEDIHWADRSTRDLLQFLVRNQRGERLAIVATYRSDEIHPDHPLRAVVGELQRSPRVERLELRRFTREELATQLEGILGESPEPSLLERILERSQGNAFFAEELVAAADGGGLPESLRDALLVRLQRLGGAALGVVRAAAVAGRSVDHRLLAAVAGLPAAELGAAIREAVDQQLLVGEGMTYRFRHALLREAVYADLLPAERATLHAALAAALDAHPELGAPAELAHHSGAAGDDERALGAWVRAGREAERVRGTAEAHQHFEHALALWERVAEPERVAGIARAELLRRAADDAYLGGAQARAAELCRMALDELDVDAEPVAAALLYERLGRYVETAGAGGAGALEAYRRAVALMPAEPPSAERALVLAAEGQQLMLTGHPEESRQRCEEAIAVARAAGARAEEGHALNTLGCNLFYLGDGAGAEARLREAQAIAREAGDAEELARTYVNLAETLDESGRTEDGLRLGLEGARVAREHGLERSYMLWILPGAATRAIKLGRMDDADRWTAESAALPGTGTSVILVGDARGRLELRRGSFDVAARHLSMAHEAGRSAGYPMRLAPSAAALAELELWRGAPEAALEFVTETLGNAQGREYLNYTGEVRAVGARAHADLAQHARARREEERAARHAAEARALADRFDELLRTSFPLGEPPLPVRGLAAQTRAEAARADHEVEPWEAVIAAYEELGYPFEVAYARWRLAEALLEGDGDRERAAGALQAAHATAAELGAAPLVGELEALARRARVPLGAVAAEPASSSADLGLTEREVEVLRLLVDGRTNREIGAELFITAKTVSAHLSHIFTKLGVSNRAEAAAAAHRLGLALRP
jgi:DNA-binding CsgD family transcriptional regulator/tetratricopeptide (TPR) repeat protein